MSLNQRRRSSELRSITGHSADFVVRAFRRQSRFSVASSALAGVLVLTLLIDLLVGHPHLQRQTVIAWLLSYVFFMLLPLFFGRRYERAAGLCFIAFVTFWSAYSLTHAVHAHALLNPLLEAPMIGLYLGWFYRGLVARLTIIGYLFVLSVAVLGESGRFQYEFSAVLVLAYAILITEFCLETGAHLYRRSRHLSMIDPLTQTFNRRGLKVFGEQAIESAEKSGVPFSFFVIDFDNFKAINDDSGHAAGDEALRVCSESWLSSTQGDDFVARLGGDEFALLIHGDWHDACARVLTLNVTSPYAWSWGHVQFEPGDTLDALMHRADEELFREKRAREF